MNATAYAFLGLTALVAMLVGVLVFAVLRFAAAARDSKRALGDTRAESLFLASALEEAFAKLKAQERATAARAEASERLNSQIVASLTSGLIVVDAARQVKIINPAARRILLNDESVEGPSTDSGAAPDILSRYPSLASVIDESLHGETPIVRREITIARGSETMHLGVTVSPLATDDGPHGAICLFSDLTNVVALEEQLRLKEALARLGELTAGLAHEFRNGLATVHGYGRLLDPDTLPDPQRRYVEGIREETQALNEVVTNFLRFAKPDPIMFAPVDLRALIERAAEDVPGADITLTGEFAMVSADDVLLRQALSNLFRNSVEACSAVQRPARLTVDGRIDRRAATIQVTVADNGPGIPEDAIAKVFQPFFTMKPGGTGLGLSIVQKVIVSHNGRIVAANRPTGGAVFTFSLPLDPNNTSRKL
jgi:nitrogen fixation/metabolism regulation signal transduction histidine kinase